MMDENATDEAAHLNHEVEAEDPRQLRMITRQMDQELDCNQILQPVCGNGAGRRGKGKIETRHSGKDRPTSITALKLIAKQGADEKAQLEEWKEDLMAKLASEVVQLQKAHEEAMEAQYQEIERQRVFFTIEIEALKEEIREMKRSEEEDMQGPEAVGGRSKGPSKSAKMGEVILSQAQENTTSTDTSTVSVVRQTERQSYASVAASQPSQKPEQPWTRVSYKSRKPPTYQSKPPKAEHQGRRILFPREISGQHKSEADLMLVLNEALQKAGETQDIRFSRVRYAPSGAISALLTEKADAGLLVPRWSNLLIRAAKSVDASVVGIEILEHWQRLKVHGMPLERYLGDGKMDLLRREVESSTGIQLKTLPRWLINENRLREEQVTRDKRGSAIVITVKSESEAKQLCTSGLRFGHVVKKVEKYWEAGPSFVCMTCCGIGHERMGRCNDRPPRCIICAGLHKTSEHRCGVLGCSKEIGKVCVHVEVKCANCNGNHPANSPRCTLRHKAEKAAKKGKEVRKEVEKEKRKERMENEAGGKDREETPENDGEMDLEAEEWAQSPEGENQGYHEDESRDHTEDY